MTPRARPILFALLALSVGLALLVVVLAQQIDDARAQLVEIERQTAACPSGPSPATLATPAPPPRDGHMIPGGIDIQAALRLRVERVVEGTVDEVRFGSPAVLPPGHLHVVSLWATWCEACKELLPQLRSVFVRRASEWSRVDFVPLQVFDHHAPELAIQRYGALMPAGRAALADRSRDDAIAAALRELDLYRGELPLTLVIDCSGRVRWALTGPIAPDELLELERWIDLFLAELRDDSPNCRAPGRCGDGWCHRSEVESCPADCDAQVPLLSAPPEPALPEPRDPPRADPLRGDPRTPRCPSGCRRCDAQGRCRDVTPETKPDPPPLKPAAICGDGRCDAGETRESCCADCGCEANFECVRDLMDKQRCVKQVPGLGRTGKCGDGVCERPSESRINCCSDCGCEANLECIRGRETCSPRL